jgi:hypothetical protein
MSNKIICDDWLSPEYIARQRLIAERTIFLNEHDKQSGKSNIDAKKTRLTQEERKERRKWKSWWHEKYYNRKW